MFGITDFWIYIVFILCIASALLCVVYGIVNWNKGNNDAQELKKDEEWENEDQKIEESV